MVSGLSLTIELVLYSLPQSIVSPMKIVRRIAWVTVGFTYFLIALGGTVRVSDSGLSCPDWPLCFGQEYANPNIHAMLEESNRYTASFVRVLVIALAMSVIL